MACLPLKAARAAFAGLLPMMKVSEQQLETAQRKAELLWGRKPGGTMPLQTKVAMDEMQQELEMCSLDWALETWEE